MLCLLLLGLLAAPSLGARLLYIVHGQDAMEGQFPWQASFKVESVPANGHKCGASLISSRWLVTAGHCIRAGPSWYSVVLGVVDRRDETSEDVRELAAVMQHPDYATGPGQYPNDIAVVQLAEEVKFSDLVYPVTMASENSRDFAGEEAQLAGWGRANVGGYFSWTLKFTDAMIMSNADCKTRWPVEDMIQDNHVCTGGDGAEGACVGDDGGSLTVGTGRDAILVGIPSWAHFYCYTEWPTVYSRVSYFRDWIRETTGV